MPSCMLASEHGAWLHAQDLHALGVQHGDLLHMDNTVQMHKAVPPARAWRSLVVRHQHWRQRLYYLSSSATGAAAQQAAAVGAAVLAENGVAAQEAGVAAALQPALQPD